MFRENALKAKLARGEKPVGCWIFMAGGDTTELLSHMGFDAFLIDHEHIAASPHTLIEHMRSAQASDTTCLVRVPSHDVVTIKRVIDAGIEGVIVPTVETGDEMRAIVAACRYRPHGGSRGVGYPETRAANWGLAEIDYPHLYRDRLFIAAIVETRRGVENIDEIAAVDGLDMVIPGSGDLLADIVESFDGLTGYGSYRNPELAALIDRIERATRRAGKWLCGVSRTPAGARAMLDAGYDMVTATADSWLLIDAARRAMAELGRG